MKWKRNSFKAVSYRRNGLNPKEISSKPHVGSRFAVQSSSIRPKLPFHDNLWGLHPYCLPEMRCEPAGVHFECAKRKMKSEECERIAAGCALTFCFLSRIRAWSLSFHLFLPV